MRIRYSMSDDTEICLEDQEYSNGDGEYYRIENLDDVIVAISEGAAIIGYCPLLLLPRTYSKKKYVLNTAHIIS